MKVSPQQKIIRFFILSITLFFYNIANCLSWSGYDYDNKSAIDIGQGNLVREGLVIQFYDLKTDSYKTAKVLLIEDAAAGVKLRLHDLDNNEVRTFIME